MQVSIIIMSTAVGILVHPLLHFLITPPWLLLLLLLQVWFPMVVEEEALAKEI